MTSNNSGCTTILLIVSMSFFILMGGYLTFFSAPKLAREAREIQSMVELNSDTFRDHPSQEPLVLVGLLSDNQAEANWEGFVIYLEQEWVVEYDEDDGWEGNWETRRTVVPDLKLTLEDAQQVIVYANQELKMSGQWHETMVHIPENADEVEGYPAGSIRHVGFMDGDRVTVVGTKRDEKGVFANRLYGGERDALIDDLRTEAFWHRFFGILFGLIGLGLLASPWFHLLRK